MRHNGLRGLAGCGGGCDRTCSERDEPALCMTIRSGGYATNIGMGAVQWGGDWDVIRGLCGEGGRAHGKRRKDEERKRKSGSELELISSPIAARSSRRCRGVHGKRIHERIRPGLRGLLEVHEERGIMRGGGHLREKGIRGRLWGLRGQEEGVCRCKGRVGRRGGLVRVVRVVAMVRIRLRMRIEGVVCTADGRPASQVALVRDRGRRQQFLDCALFLRLHRDVFGDDLLIAVQL